MKPFTKNPQCDKCQGAGVHLEYFEESDREAEQLECTCLRCGYQWDMETADSARLD